MTPVLVRTKDFSLVKTKLGGVLKGLGRKLVLNKGLFKWGIWKENSRK
jgi:hypothetical protein